MKTAINNNLTAAVDSLSRYNWFTVIAQAADKEPQTIHATGIKIEMGDFLKICRQCALPVYSDNVIVDIAAAGENVFTFLTKSGTTYTIEGQHNATLADKDTATGNLTDPASLIDWTRSTITEAGNVLIVLDTGNIDNRQEARIRHYMNSHLGGLCNSRQTCRTIYFEALANSDKTIKIGLYDLEQEKQTTAKTFDAEYMDEVYSAEDKAQRENVRQLVAYVRDEMTIPQF